MNDNRRLPWLFLIVLAILSFATVLQGSKIVAQTQNKSEAIRVTPIVFLEEHIADKTQDITQFKDDLKDARAELDLKIKMESEPKPVPEEVEVIETPVKDYKDVTLTISFYTALESENGKGRANMNAIGGKLVANQSIAVPRDIPFGSVLEIEKYGKRTVDDRGSKKYIKWLNNEKTHMKVDLYVAKNDGESNKQYWKRVNNMGIVKDVKAKLYLKGD